MLPIEKAELADATEAKELEEATEKTALMLRTEQNEPHVMIDINEANP